MGFASKGVWVMSYRGCMGYEALFPANQLGGLKKVWNLREYGVCEPWVMRESTVVNNWFEDYYQCSVMKNMELYL